MFNWLKQHFRRISPPAECNGVHVDFDALKEILEYSFSDNDLFIQALKHRSYLPVNQEKRLQSNERLELLGDAVLGLVVVEYLFAKFPRKEEGEITNMKSLLVSRKILARVSRALRLGDFVLMSEAEEKSGGRARASINADVMEAVIGAIYLDGGLEPARKFVEEKLLVSFEDIVRDEHHTNFKSMLLEYAQSQSLGSPSYLVQSVEGPDHEKVFTIQVKIQDDILGHGSANSKKRAEQLAAQEALRNLYII
jgi:ribonuclease-3